MRKLIGILLVVVLFASCKKDTPTTSPTAPTITSISPTSGSANTVVIIKGTNFKTTVTADTVKFNGVVATVQLTNDTMLTVFAPMGGTTGVVTVTTSDGTATGPVFTYAANTSRDVYVAGYENNINGFGVVKYWKNGVAVELSDGTKNGYATSIAVSASDVYVAGNVGYIAEYWKNGVPVILTNVNSNANAIALAGNDVYVAGWENNVTGKSVAKYWKNGVGIALSNGANHAYAESIVIAGTDVYVAGYEYNANNVSVAKYWKNGQAVSLTNGISFGEAYSITVMGNDVYVAGMDSSSARYWKNGVPIALNNNKNSKAFSISVFANDVYVAGYDGSGIKYVAQYWKNSNVISLTDGINHNGTAYAISVVDNNVYVAGVDGGSNPKSWKNDVATSLTTSQRISEVYGIFIK